MAIRLSRDIKREAPTTGFDLIFTDGTTYNLDALFANRNRSASNSKLVLQVRKDSEIAPIVEARFKTEIRETINATFSDTQIENQAKQIIMQILADSKTTLSNLSLYPDVKKYIEKKLSDFYKGILGYNISVYFNVINSSTQTIEIKYYDIDEKQLTSKYNQVYDEVLSEISAKGSEGSLAISDKKIKLNLSPSDYSKYLLNNNKNSNSSCSNTTSENKKFVLWTDATDDTTTENDVKNSLYNDVNNLQNIVNELTKKIDNFKECDCGFEVSNNDDGTFDLGSGDSTLVENEDGTYDIQ